MAFRSDILAGKAVIQVSLQDNIDAQLKGIRSKLFSFSNSIGKIGQDLFAFGAVGSIGAIFPVKQFADYQDSILFLQSKLKDTGVDIVQLEKYIRELGRTTSFTSKEVAEAGAVLAQAGLGKGVQPTLLPVLDLARGARVDIDTAARILANIVTAFDIPFEKANEVASKLTTAARLGTTDIILLGESLKESLTTFRQLGVPLEDALALLTSLSNVSLRGTKSGTSLNTAFANLASKLPQLEELGIIIDPKVDFKDPINIFKKLDAELSKLAPTDQVRELQSLFNIRGARGFGGILVQDLDKLQDILKKVKESSNEARESSDILDSRLGGVFRRLKSAFEESILSIGETTEGPLTKFGTKLTGTFNSISELATGFPELTQAILLLPPVSLAAGVGLIGLSFAASRLGIVLSGLININKLFLGSLRGIASIALGPVTAGIQTFYSQPVARFSSIISKENAAIIKAQARLDKELGRSRINPGNLAQARTALATAQANRSFFNIPITFRPNSVIAPVENLFKKLSNAYLRGYVALGRTNRIASRQFNKDLRTSVSKDVLGFERLANPLTSSPTTGNVKPSQFTPLYTGIKKQLEFQFRDNPVQLELDFSPKPNFSPAKQLSFGLVFEQLLDFDGSAGQKPVASLTNALDDAVRTALPIGSQPALQQQLFKFTEELTGPIKQQLFDFSDGPLPVKLPNVTPAATAAVAKQLDFGDRFFSQLGLFDDLPKPATQLGLFDNIVDDVADAAKTVDKVVKTSAIGDLTGTGSSGRFKPNKSLSLGGLLGRGLKESLPSLSGVGKGLSNIFGLLRNVNVFKALTLGIRGTIRTTNLLTGFFKGLFSVLNTIRRGVFSLTGITAIIEFLIIAGPKIAPIRAILDGISAAFGAFFKTIRETGAAVIPIIRDLFSGLNEVAFGDPTNGINQIKVSLMGLRDVLSTGFALAWERFKAEAQKGIEFVQALFVGLLSVIKGIGEVVSSVASTLFSPRPRDGQEPDAFDFGTGPIDFIKSLVEGLLAGITGIGEIFIGFANVIRTLLIGIGNTLLDIYRLLLSYIGDDQSQEEFDTGVGRKFALADRIKEYEAQLAQLLEDGFESPSLIQFDNPVEGFNLLKERYERNINALKAELDALGGPERETNYLERELETFRKNMAQIAADFRKALEGIDVNTEGAEERFEFAKEFAKFSQQNENFRRFSGIDLNSLIGNARSGIGGLFQGQDDPNKSPFPSFGEFSNREKDTLNNRIIENARVKGSLEFDSSPQLKEAARLLKEFYAKISKGETREEQLALREQFGEILTVANAVFSTNVKRGQFETDLQYLARRGKLAELVGYRPDNEETAIKELLQKTDAEKFGFNATDLGQGLGESVKGAFQSLIDNLVTPIFKDTKKQIDDNSEDEFIDFRAKTASDFAKAIVGSYRGVERQKLQAVPNEVDKRIAEAAEDIAKTSQESKELLANLSNGRTPFVFQA